MFRRRSRRLMESEFVGTLDLGDVHDAAVAVGVEGVVDLGLEVLAC